MNEVVVQIGAVMHSITATVPGSGTVLGRACLERGAMSRIRSRIGGQRLPQELRRVSAKGRADPVRMPAGVRPGRQVRIARDHQRRGRGQRSGAAALVPMATLVESGCRPLAPSLPVDGTQAESHRLPSPPGAEMSTRWRESE